jgi:hypothetical protein
VNLAELRDFCDNLLDYAPVNDVYEDQLGAILNDAQSRVLTDRSWDFAQNEIIISVKTDITASVGVSNGSATVTGGPFAFSADAVLPGSDIEGAEISITDSATVTSVYEVRFVSATNQLFLDRDFTGVSGTYTATIKLRDIKLPIDTMTVMSVVSTANNPQRKQATLTRAEVDAYGLDRDALGTADTYIPSKGYRVLAPRAVSGASAVTVSAGQGVRTVNVFMVNVRDPGLRGAYREGVSAGLESGLSPVLSFDLTDTQELALTPETLPSSTGLYRRYYFTCPDLGIKAPVRLRSVTVGSEGVDTVPPSGSVTLSCDTSVTTLSSQSFQALSIRYVYGGGAYQTLRFYRHPSADEDFRIRRVLSPERMIEDQDVPLVPSEYAVVIAYEALTALALKVAPALASVFSMKKLEVFRGMEQAFLRRPSRRIVRGGGPTVYGGLTGPITFIP